jgi:hypothetical protein
MKSAEGPCLRAVAGDTTKSAVTPCSRCRHREECRCRHHEEYHGPCLRAFAADTCCGHAHAVAATVRKSAVAMPMGSLCRHHEERCGRAYVQSLPTP